MSCNSLLSSSNADLARFYLMGEASGTTATDLSSAGDDGTYARDATNTTTTGPGKGFEVGQSFNGTSDQILSSATSLIDEDTTLVAWLNTADAGGGHIVSNHDATAGGLSLYMTSGGRLAGYIHSTAPSANSDVAVNDSSWHHCAVSYASSGRGLAYYVDGVAQGTATASGTWTTAKAYAVGGKEGSTATVDAISGSLAAAAVFSAVLSSTEVAQLAAGPEPIWLGTGTHHFGIARGIAYWNCPSSSWGLPTYLNAASTDNGSLTAEVRIVRDRGKATEAVVATTTGFSGSVACAGSTDNLTLELRVSNDGGYDDSLGDDADGWVSVAWYGLEAKLEASYLLDEQSGDVARNQVRTLAYEETFDSVGSTDADGDLPSSAIAYSFSLDGDETKTRSISGGKIRIDFTAGATSDTDYFGYRVTNPGLVVGVTYVAEIEGRVLSKTGSSQVRLAGDGWHNVTETADPAGEFSARIAFEYNVSSVGYSIIAATYAANASISFEIDSVKFYAENAGTFARDASNTYTAISNLGLIDGGQDFNGSSDYVDCGAIGLTDADQTITCWVKTSTVTAGYLVSSRDSSNGGLSLYANPGRVQALIGTTLQDQASTTINDGAWHHCAVVYRTGIGCQYYVDGVPDGADLTPTGTWNSGVDTLIGARANAPSSHWIDGIVSQAAIYSRALTGPEIAQLYAQGPTALVDVGRVAHYLLEEMEGDVCRNQIRTTVYDDDFTGGSTTTADGDVPTGWTAYKSAVLPTFSLSDSGSTTTITADGEGSATAFVGVQKTTGLTSGVAYVVAVRYRVRSRSGAPSLSVFGGAWQSKLLDSVALNEWQTAEFTFTATSAVLAVAAGIFPSSEAVVIEIDSVEVYEENAGTPSEDMSGLTAPGVSGRGVLMDGTQHILAPYPTGFGSYPFSMGCAFRHDGTAAARFLIAITDPDALGVYWSMLLAADNDLLVQRRNTTTINTNTDASPDTNWHTVLAVFPDATSVIVYLDGVEIYNQTGLTSVAATSAADGMMVGDVRTIDVSSQWIGDLDEASFWTRALSAAEAAEWHQFTIFPLAARHSAEPLGLETSLSL